MTNLVCGQKIAACSDGGDRKRGGDSKILIRLAGVLTRFIGLEKSFPNWKAEAN